MGIYVGHSSSRGFMASNANIRTASTWTNTSSFTNFVDPNSSSNWIWNINVNGLFGIGVAGIIEWKLLNNPNGGGSGYYKTHAMGYVCLSTGWHGSNYTPEISTDTSIYTGTGSINAYIYHNATESGGGITGDYETALTTAQAGGGGRFWSSAGIYLRFRQTSGFNTSYPGAKDLILTAYGAE